MILAFSTANSAYRGDYLGSSVGIGELRAQPRGTRWVLLMYGGGNERCGVGLGGEVFREALDGAARHLVKRDAGHRFLKEHVNSRIEDPLSRTFSRLSTRHHPVWPPLDNIHVN